LKRGCVDARVQSLDEKELGRLNSDARLWAGRKIPLS
jgi:hypothetical protein